MKKLCIVIVICFYHLSSIAQDFVLTDYTLTNPTGSLTNDGSVVINSFPPDVNPSTSLFFLSDPINDTMIESPLPQFYGLKQNIEYFFYMITNDCRYFEFKFILSATSGDNKVMSIGNYLLIPESTQGACDGSLFIQFNDYAPDYRFRLHTFSDNTTLYDSIVTGPTLNINNLCIDSGYVSWLLWLNHTSGVSYGSCQQSQIYNGKCQPDIYIYATPSANNTSCDGSSFISLQNSFFSQNSNITFEFSNGLILSEPYGSFTEYNFCPGTYWVKATDGYGISRQKTFIIGDASNTLQPFTLDVTVIPGSDSLSCNGQASLNISGGTPPFSYLFSNGDTTVISDSLCSAYYWVSVTDSAGYIVNNTFYVNDTLNLIDNFQTYIATSGSSDTVSCNGTAQVFTNNGIPPFTYIFSSGETNDIDSGLCIGIYTVTTVDAIGTSITDTFIIYDETFSIINITLDVIHSSDTISCDGSVTIAATGGIPPYSFNYSTGGTSMTEDSLCTGTYYVMVTDSVGNVAFSSFILYDSLSVALSFSSSLQINHATNSLICDGSAEVTLSGGMPPYQINFSTGGTNFQELNLCPGNYFYTISDAFNNSITDTFDIYDWQSINEPFFVGVETTPASDSSSCNGSAFLNINGGIPPFTISFSSGENSTFDDLLCPGYNSVIVFDALNRLASTDFYITDSTSLIVLYDSLLITDTLYSNALLNCDLDLSFPLQFDSMYIDTVYMIDSAHIFVGTIIIQDTNVALLEEIYYFDTTGNFWIVMDVYCNSRNLEAYFTLNFSIDLLDYVTTVNNRTDFTEFKIYPNPFESNYTLEFDLIKEEQITFELTDISGKIISSQKYSGSNGKNRLNFDFSNLSNGLYLFRIISENGQSGSKKIVKN